MNVKKDIKNIMDNKKSKFKLLLNRLLVYIRNFILLMLVLAIIGCLKDISSYTVSLILYSLSTILVLLPIFNNLLGKISIKLTKYQKIFIIFFTYLPLGFVNKISRASYIQTLITFLLILIVWILVCIYSKFKKIK